jgi:hypothetical protein
MTKTTSQLQRTWFERYQIARALKAARRGDR